MARCIAAASAWGLVFGFGLCDGAEYSYPLPQVLGSPHGEQNLTIDLGGEFASISEARLHIAGSHTPGLLGDLNSANTHPYLASVDAYSRAEPFSHSGILGELLPADAGSFEIDEPFHRLGAGGQPDFTTWLDGTANFNFRAGPSAYLAIYNEIERPVVEITSAVLVVTGHRVNGVVPNIGDLDGNGTVDGHDLARWKGDFGANAGGDADGDEDTDGSDFLL